MTHTPGGRSYLWSIRPFIYRIWTITCFALCNAVWMTWPSTRRLNFWRKTPLRQRMHWPWQTPTIPRRWLPSHSGCRGLSRCSNHRPIFIDDSPGLSIFDFRAKCRRLKAQHNIELVIIDYLQLMSAKDGRNNGNREQEISTISRSIKEIAKELNIPIIALAQLSRYCWTARKLSDFICRENNCY